MTDGARLRRIGVGLGLVLLVAAGPAHSASRPPAVEADCLQDGRARIDADFARWHGLLDGPDGPTGSELHREAEEVVSDVFAVDFMAAHILGGRWADLERVERDRFREALVRALRMRILPVFQRADGIPALRPADEEWQRDGRFVRARYWLMGSGTEEWLTLRLTEEADGSCAIADVRRGDRSLLGSLDDRVEDLVEEYSFPYMVAKLGDHDAVILEDFEDDPVGSLPQGWDWKDKDDDKRKPYRVRSDDGNHYLEATDEGESVILGNEISWNIDEYPYISFRVRVNRIPEGGNERDDDRVDSAAGIYLTLNKKLFGQIPESVKYVWSSTLPVGTAVQREGIGRPWQIVFGSGREGLGEWRTYVFDLEQAYRDTFGGEPPTETVGLGVLSDANSLNSQAYADYDDFRALRTAPPGVTSGVREIVPPVEDDD